MTLNTCRESIAVALSRHFIVKVFAQGTLEMLEDSQEGLLNKLGRHRHIMFLEEPFCGILFIIY